MFTKASSKTIAAFVITAGCAIATLSLSSTANAQTPFTNACNKVDVARITAFRDAIGSSTSGAIQKAHAANQSGQALRDSYGPDATEGGAWTYVYGLQESVAMLEPTNQHLCGEWLFTGTTPAAVNMMACFRVYIVPQLEHELYWSTLHAWYNKPQYASRPEAVASFNAIRDLLKEARNISNDATTCLFESSNDHLEGPGTLVDPN
jgi:hypothetical protein